MVSMMGNIFSDFCIMSISCNSGPHVIEGISIMMSTYNTYMMLNNSDVRILQSSAYD